jgi:hypothetical protein
MTKTPSAPQKRARPSRESRSMLLIVAIVAVAGVALFAFWRSRGSSETTDTAAAVNAPVDAAAVPNAPGAHAEANTVLAAQNEAAAAAAAKLGPHKQAALPPIPFRGYAPPRPPEVVTAAFHFAAEHPEVLSYIPCFCGCERGGHRGNADCFVRSRAANGDVLEWEEHGVECAVCIDVATRSRQMYASGASVASIRTAIEKEYSPQFVTMTPTPKPPVHAH